MQSTGQTSRQASQPVQLSALITATSLGSFFRDPLFAMQRTFQSDFVGWALCPSGRVFRLLGSAQGWPRTGKVPHPTIDYSIDNSIVNAAEDNPFVVTRFIGSGWNGHYA